MRYQVGASPPARGGEERPGREGGARSARLALPSRAVGRAAARPPARTDPLGSVCGGREPCLPRVGLGPLGPHMCAWRGAPGAQGAG